jgi:hypothetical protein
MLRPFAFLYALAAMATVADPVLTPAQVARVVGVVSAKLKGRRGRLAIPINEARRLISSAAARPQ